MPKRTLFIALLVGFAMWALIFCVPPMEHILSERLHLTHTQTSLLYSAPVLMMVATAIPAGIIADRIGVKKAIGIGLIIMAIGATMRGTVTSYSALLAFTFIYGLGFGWTFPNFPKLVSNYVHRERANVSMGILNSGMPAGTALGLALTIPVVLPATNTYQGVFFIWSIPILVATALWWVLVKEPPRRFNDFQQSATRNSAFRTIIRNKHLWLVSSLMFLHQFFMWTWSGWTPTLMMLKGATPSLAGLIASTTIWAIIPAFLLMPRLSFKLGVRKPFLWAPSIVLALAAWGVINVSISLSWYIMALVGIAAGTRFTMLLSLPVEMMHEEEVGTASGIMLSVGFTGGVVGPIIGGNILDNTNNLDLSLIILVGASLVAAFIASRIPETGAGRRRRLKQLAQT